MKTILILTATWLCFVSSAFAGEQTQMPVMTAPQVVLQVVGENKVELGPSRYPQFYDHTSDNPNCDAYLETAWENQGEKPGDAAKNGLSLAPLWLKSSKGKDDCSAPLSGKPEPVIISGLKGTINIPENSRKTMNILFTWTVRVEGYKLDAAYTIWPCLCSGWHGTTYQRFPSGEAETMLYVNNKKRGQPSKMTIPSGGNIKGEQPWDPTHTGSCLLIPEDFGGELPAELTVEIKWYNDTSLKIVSPANMRSLIVTLLPKE